MKIDTEGCLKYIKEVAKVELSPYQEIAVRAMCEGMNVWASTSVRRRYLAGLIGQYVAAKLANNDENVKPDVTIIPRRDLDINVVPLDGAGKEVR